jgi:cell division control protein 6
MGRFTDTSSVFKNRDALGDNYIPDSLVCREEEEEDLIHALIPVAEGDEPNNAFIYGDTGVGKTVATRMILDELKEDTKKIDGVNLTVVWENCKTLTSYETAISLVNQFRDSSNKLSMRGHAEDKVYDLLWDYLDESDSTHVIFVLDEIDSLGENDDLLYQIPRARANGNLENTKIGIIGISNNFTYRESLSARVTSTLCEKEIRFGPYDATELKPILNQRAEKAFVDGSIDDAVIAKTAAKAAQDTGSARHGLDILREAGDMSRREGTNKVTEEHVDQAYNAVERGKVRKQLLDLPIQSHLVLQALLDLFTRDETPAKKTDVYKRYELFADKIDAEIKAPRTIHDRLNQLSLNGFIIVNQHNQGRDGGMYNQYELDIDPDLVQDVLNENTRLGGLSENEKLSDYT